MCMTLGIFVNLKQVDSLIVHQVGFIYKIIQGCTYSLTPWSRVLLEKLTSKLCSQSRNSPHLWNLKVPHRKHKCPPPVPILSQLHPDPTTPSNFLKVHFNIIFPSTSWSPQWPLSLRLPYQHTRMHRITKHKILLGVFWYSLRSVQVSAP